MPRYAILEHDHPALHWDLLLEHGSACRTWRLTAPPGDGDAIRAEPLPDHRLAYLDYEGPVSGGRGAVSRWDAGRFVWLRATEECAAVLLEGRRWSGRLEIVRMDDGFRVQASPGGDATGRVT